MNFLGTLFEYATAKRCAKKQREENQKKKVVRVKGKPKLKKIIRNEKERKTGRINKYRNK